jgi:hypothetical protein
MVLMEQSRKKVPYAYKATPSTHMQCSGVFEISLQSSKPLMGFTDGPLRVRLSLSGDKQLDH